MIGLIPRSRGGHWGMIKATVFSKIGTTHVRALLNIKVSVKVFIKKPIKVHKSTQLCLQLKSCRDKSNVCIQ